MRLSTVESNHYASDTDEVACNASHLRLIDAVHFVHRHPTVTSNP